MKYFIGLFFCFSLCSCATKKVEVTPPLGKILKRRLVCTEPNACKQKMAETCPAGGILYGGTRAFIVEFSCR